MTTNAYTFYITNINKVQAPLPALNMATYA